MRLGRRYRVPAVLLLVMLGFMLSIILFGEKQFLPAHLSGTPYHAVVPRVPRKTASAYNPVPGVRLVIPVISVNAAIEPVGTLPDGRMAVPLQQQWDDVGWYRNGPYPGERGSAVIDGHLDRPGGLPAVFWRLHMLHIGDDVLIVTSGVRPLHFRVLSSDAYAPATAPLPAIFGDDTGTFLNLITCAGAWIPSLRQTTLRLVVHAVLVPNASSPP